MPQLRLGRWNSVEMVAGVAAQHWGCGQGPGLDTEHLRGYLPWYLCLATTQRKQQQKRKKEAWALRSALYLDRQDHEAILL